LYGRSSVRRMHGSSTVKPCPALTRQCYVRDMTRRRWMAVALEPSFALARDRAHSNLGHGYALLHLKEYRRAIDDFDEALKAVPRSSTALAWRGCAHESRLGNRDKAVADYKAALAIDPKQRGRRRRSQGAERAAAVGVRPVISVPVRRAGPVQDPSRRPRM